MGSITFTPMYLELAGKKETKEIPIQYNWGTDKAIGPFHATGLFL